LKTGLASNCFKVTVLKGGAVRVGRPSHFQMLCLPSTSGKRIVTEPSSNQLIDVLPIVPIAMPMPSQSSITVVMSL
jgi:hypothetical protein